jgi:hypothetical protein
MVASERRDPPRIDGSVAWNSSDPVIVLTSRVCAGMTDGSDLPRGIGAPATRALTAAGFTRLEQLHGVPAAELSKLHGVGPKAIRVLGEVLEHHGYALG